MTGSARPEQPAENGLRPLPPAPPPPAPAPATKPSLETLDAIGRENETVRNVCKDMMRKVSSLATLGGDLDVLFTHIEQILQDFERTRSELAQRDAVLAIVQQEFDGMRVAQASLTEEHERIKSECSVLRPENQRLLDKVRNLQARLDDLESQWSGVRNSLDETQAELQSQKARAGYLGEEVEGLRAEVEKSDGLVSTLQSELGEQRFKLNVAEESSRALQASLTESQIANARLTAESENVKTALETERQRLVALEAEMLAQQSEQTRLRTEQQEEIDQQRAALTDLQARHDNLQALNELIERTLTETRAELQARTDELRAEERRTRVAVTAAGLMEKKLQAEATSTAELQERVTELDKNRTTLIAQIKPLLQTIQDKNEESEKLQATIASLRTRLEQETKTRTADHDRMDATIRDLTARLEDEKARRALAEGALEEDRRARVELQVAASAAKAAAVPEQRRPAATAAKRPVVRAQSA